jgi:hypothetical protein
MRSRVDVRRVREGSRNVWPSDRHPARIGTAFEQSVRAVDANRLKRAGAVNRHTAYAESILILFMRAVSFIVTLVP